ncbi:hypothetical protein [Paraburkholderia nodosa]|uniref:hypothetical protein n=1 Tax=Paraburkholderia nodosa TaxID=392320 RepID=UPI000481030F|nr:hypothetical protein [Paraburkholderia nodosa]
MNTDAENTKATSTEITGGAVFTYEDTVVAYYLVALLRGKIARRYTRGLSRAWLSSGTVVIVGWTIWL